MALIAMAVYDTVENERSKYTEESIFSILDTVDIVNKHRLIIVDNNSCQRTKDFLEENKTCPETQYYEVITNKENIGTAEAINLAWKNRIPGEHCIKIDNDVIINQKNWVDEMEEVIRRKPSIGQVGLKRKDIQQLPNHPDNYFRTELQMLQHQPGESWMVIEKSEDIMGTCVIHSSELLDKVGYLYQIGVYGFDDALMSLRSRIAGFTNCFLPHINIDHIDTGENSYSKEKIELATKAWPAFNKVKDELLNKKMSVYYNPYDTVTG